MAAGHEHHVEETAGPKVLSVSEKNPKVRTVQLTAEPMGAERAFLPAILKGLGVTARHFFGNVFRRKETVTVEYPDEKFPYPERYRGVHRLMLREDGNEKYPVVFEIDELRCVVCGLCVEACPCDAIRMDTGVHMPPSTERGDGVLGKVDLMKRGTLSSATQGGVGDAWDRKDTIEERGPESKVPAAPR